MFEICNGCSAETFRLMDVDNFELEPYDADIRKQMSALAQGLGSLADGVPKLRELRTAL